MILRYIVATAYAAMLLAGCGGGGGGGKKSPAPAPVAEVTVTLASSPITQTLDYADDFSTVLDGSWTGKNLGNAAVYLQVSDSGNVFVVPAMQSASGSTFRFTVNLSANARAGDRTGLLTVKACKDAACAQIFAGTSSASVTYRLQINAVGEWETFQRDASHSAYVPIRLDPTRFAKAWEWTFPQDAAATDSSITRPATGPGVMIVLGENHAADGSRYGARLIAVDENTGALKWSRSGQSEAAAPAVGNGLIYLSPRNSAAAITAYDAATGEQRFKYMEPTLPDAAVLTPTLFGGDAYFFAGPNGEQIHGMNGSTGERRWAKPRSGALTYSTPAVDQNLVYYHTGSGVELLDRQTGNSVAVIADPASDGTGYPGSNAPMLGSSGNVIVNSYILETSTKLSSFNIANRQWEWSSEHSYRALPAVAGGVIYAIRRGTPTLDALDEASGAILWSWIPPAEDQQTLNMPNVVVTKNLVFVSTSSQISTNPGYVWAIDRATHQVAWRYPEQGYIVISANRTMYVLTRPKLNRIVAIKLR